MESPEDPSLAHCYLRKLKPNSDKTDFFLIGSKVLREKNSKCFPTGLLVQEVTPSPSARNLGIMFGIVFDFKFKSHMSGISRACYYHKHDMRRIRCFLTLYVAKTISTDYDV